MYNAPIPDPRFDDRGTRAIAAVALGLAAVTLGALIDGAPPVSFFTAVAATSLLVCVALNVGLARGRRARAAAETAARAGEHRLQLVSDNMSDTITILDGDNRCSWLSTSVQKVYGFPASELLGKPALELVHPVDAEMVRRAFRRGITERQPSLHLQYRCRHAHGRHSWVESTLRILYDPDGAYAGAVVSSRDISARREAEEALRSTYRVVVNSPGVVFRWRNAPGWPVQLVTENIARYGYSAAELLSGAVPFAALVHPDDLDIVAEEVRRHVAAGRDAFHQEYRILARDGGSHWVDDHTVVERDESGAVVGFQGIVVDVTRRREAEIALRQSEENFSRLLRTSADAVVVARLADGRYLEVNPGFTALTGYSAREAVSRTSAELGILVPDGTRADLVREVNEMGWIPNRDIRFRRKNGDLRFGQISASIVQIAGTPCLLSITKDVTARKQLEREHEERRRFLERVLSNAPDAIVTSDALNRIVLWNEGARRLFGFNAEEARGRTIDELIAGPPGDARREAECWSRLVASGIGLPPTETVRFRSDGEPVHVIASVTPIEVDGQTVEVVAIYTDTSERFRAAEAVRALNAQLEERVRQRTRELEAANRELEAFAYSVSHDLRAPLRGITGFSTALAEDCGAALDAGGRELVARIRADARRMGELIDGLLALFRVSRGGLAPQPMDLAEVAREILADLARRDAGRRVQVRVPERLSAWCDQRLMRSVLENLLGNAWKYTARRPIATIEIGAEASPDGSAYFVRDNGAGFDIAYAGRLFNAFQRLHKVEEFPGIGLGLANVQRIIHRHGGRVWAESRPDAGATFWFTLPGSAAAPR